MDKLKKHYLFLFIIAIIGIVMGIIFANIISLEDEKIVYSKITTYFNNLKDDVPINYLYNLFQSIKENLLYLIIIWILGLSIIGLLFNNFIVFFKGFILGFSVGSIINIYLYSGIILAIIYVFPTIIFNTFIYLIMTYYANGISFNLFNVLFKKKDIKFAILMKRYFRIFYILGSLLIVSSLYETFVTPFFLKLFTFLIK